MNPSFSDRIAVRAGLLTVLMAVISLTTVMERRFKFPISYSPFSISVAPPDSSFNLTFDPKTQLVTIDDPSPTVSVRWDRATQQAIINTAPGPTIASRAYAMVHTAIYDAWSAYDPAAIGTQLGDTLQRPQSENTEANKTEAMSFAAYRVLSELFPDQVDLFDGLMAELGYDPDNITTDTTTPAGIGNVAAAAFLKFCENDGSNQLGTDPHGDGTPYSDISGYHAPNPVADPVDIELWTPERVPIDPMPGQGQTIQYFLTPHWGSIVSFSLASGGELRPPKPEPFLLVEGEVNLEAKTIALADGTTVDISPDLVGTIINPAFIEAAESVVNYSANLTDKQKLIAEFWEDAKGTSFPPGTWMAFGEFVSARDDHTLDEDVKLFLSLGNAVFDAGIATWESKVFYNYARPVRTVRKLGELGLIGEFDAELGGFAIEAWGGPGKGTQRILARDFITYQMPGSDASPPFSEYVSGHSTFSAAGAEILRRFTGSDEFGASVTFAPGESRFEPGITPKKPVTLTWKTFGEAADEAGISRLYGGIHFSGSDRQGRVLGKRVGERVWEASQSAIAPHTILGANDNNHLIGMATNTLIYGNRGNDRIQGLEGHDVLCGGKGNDTIDAGSGNDIISGHGGDDVLKGGPGGDRFDFGLNHGNNIIVDFEDGIDAIGLEPDLTFDQLTISQSGNDTRIEGDGLSIRLRGVESRNIDKDDFIEL